MPEKTSRLDCLCCGGVKTIEEVVAFAGVCGFCGWRDVASFAEYYSLSPRQPIIYESFPISAVSELRLKQIEFVKVGSPHAEEYPQIQCHRYLDHFNGWKAVPLPSDLNIPIETHRALTGCHSFIFGGISPHDFESVICADTGLEGLIGKPEYLDLISADFGNDSLENMRLIVRLALGVYPFIDPVQQKMPILKSRRSDTERG